MHDRLHREQRTKPGSAPAGYLRAGTGRVGLFCRADDCDHPAFRRDGDQRSLPALLAAAADRDAHELAVHGLVHVRRELAKPDFSGARRWHKKAAPEPDEW